jgi:hypothetical protein
MSTPERSVPPLAHQVIFQGRRPDAAWAREYLIRALTDLGCAVDENLAAPHVAGLCLPTGGSAILTVGRTPKNGLAGACSLVANLTVTNPQKAASEDISALLQALDRLPLTDWEITRVVEQMPITRTLADHLGHDVFAGLSLLCAIHHMREFTVTISALISCGADPALITIINKGTHIGYGIELTGGCGTASASPSSTTRSGPAGSPCT